MKHTNRSLALVWSTGAGATLAARAKAPIAQRRFLWALLGLWTIACLLVGLVTAAHVDRLERENEQLRSVARHYRKAAMGYGEQLWNCKEMLDNLRR